MQDMRVENIKVETIVERAICDILLGQSRCFKEQEERWASKRIGGKSDPFTLLTKAKRALKSNIVL